MKETIIHHLNPVMSVQDADAMAGVLLKDNDYQILIDYDADVYDQETGALLAKFRRNVISPELVKASYYALRKAASPNSGRAYATGLPEDDSNTSGFWKMKKDGTFSNTKHAKGIINSGIIGFFDRTPRFPYCRTTAFNQKEFSKFKAAYPLIRLVSEKFKELVPERYMAQKKMVESTLQEYVIEGTVFTTVTVNKNWQTAVHKDKGDLKEGFGNLVALRKGRYTGGFFVLPRWGVAFDIQNQDILFVDVHEWHGNTPIHPEHGAERISLVMYYRKKMVECGSPAEELERSKRLRS